jgi:hypothetical protein
MQDLKDKYVQGSFYPRSYKGKSDWFQVKKSKTPVTLGGTKKIEILYELAKNGF